MTRRVPGGGIGRNPFGAQWVGAKSGPESLGAQVQDRLFGGKKPPLADPDDAATAPLMARLHAYRRRLERLVGDPSDTYDLVLATGTIAMIDEQCTIYIGQEFLLRYADDLPLQLGVVAHEMGHRPARWQEYRNQAPQSQEAMDDLCRLEETRADYFAGYALGQLGFDAEPLCHFLEQIDEGPHPEYLSTPMRIKTIREGHGSGRRKDQNRRKFFPEFSRMSSSRGDLGEG